MFGFYTDRRLAWLQVRLKRHTCVGVTVKSPLAARRRYCRFFVYLFCMAVGNQRTMCITPTCWYGVWTTGWILLIQIYWMFPYLWVFCLSLNGKKKCWKFNIFHFEMLWSLYVPHECKLLCHHYRTLCDMVYMVCMYPTTVTAHWKLGNETDKMSQSTMQLIYSSSKNINSHSYCLGWCVQVQMCNCVELICVNMCMNHGSKIIHSWYEQTQTEQSPFLIVYSFHKLKILSLLIPPVEGSKTHLVSNVQQKKNSREI